MRPSIQHTLTPLPPPLPKHLNKPLRQRESPMARNQNPTDHIHNLDHKSQEAISALLDAQKYRLDIVFEEDTWHISLAYDVWLFGYTVLVCEERAVGIGRACVDRVDGRDDREEVLELEEVIGGCGDGSVERVDQGGVEVSKG